jgi:hypothetical protein
VHAWSKYRGRDLGADIVQGFGEDAHRVPWRGGVGVFKGDGQDDALAGKDRLAVRAILSVKEPLDPKETTRSS